MKTLKYLIGAASALMLVSFAVSSASAQVSGSKHDLRPLFDASGVGDEICVFCHTPHSSNADAPLWNRTGATATFTMYDSPTMDNPNSTGPQGVSAGCLSCHDGATALNALKNGTLTETTGALPADGTIGDIILPLVPFTGNGDFGGDLTDDHPISITYAGGAAGDWNSPPTNSIPLYGAGDDQVECGSCHNPHGGVASTPFLRFTNAGSQLCLSCHKK